MIAVGRTWGLGDVLPLTPAHAAAALPIRLLLPSLPVVATILGSMSPDFVYLLHLAPRGGFGHTLPGVFLFCLPVSLAIWAVFEFLFRPRNLRAGRVAPALVAILIGAASHIAWDGLTHGDGWAVARIPFLRREFGAFPIYKFLQHGGTIGGLAVLLGWGVAHLQSLPWRALTIAQGLAVLGISSAALLICGAAGLGNALRAPSGGAVALGYAAVGSMVGFAACGLAIGVLYRISCAFRASSARAG